MKSTLLLAFALVAFAGCDVIAPSSDSNASASAATSADSRGVVHHVSAGGNDACEAFGLEPGCDGNFSLTARVMADGSVKGQHQDTFAGGGNGIHATIDCVNIVGNGAVLGGTITRGGFDGDDWTGQTFLTAVVDNGTSANDPPDQISFSFNALPITCNDLVPANFPLSDLTRGQVRVD